tara:strand:- start:104 stop:391 length:288 start_codon:yes stop_codon:yes gene_type:complete
VNTIKKFKFTIILILFFVSKSLAFSPEYEKEMFIGCYSNSKSYIGPDGAKEYCLCTIDMLSDKYSDEEIDLIFQKTPEEIMKATEFASIHCENNK